MAKIYKEVIWDLETKKLFGDLEERDPSLLGVSIVSLYNRKIDKDLKEISGKLKSFWEKDLNKMWSIFQEADRIIGFNSLNFDVAVLKPLAPAYFPKLRHFDIMSEVKKIINHRISLDALAKTTLNKQKTDSGINAVQYYTDGDQKSLEKLKKYCEADVLLTKELYDYVLKNKELKYLDKWNTPRTIEVDFSYKDNDESQESLF